VASKDNPLKVSKTFDFKNIESKADMGSVDELTKILDKGNE
jgi:hypothetical protein